MGMEWPSLSFAVAVLYALFFEQTVGAWLVVGGGVVLD